MKEVTEEIERLQARLIAAGGGQIVITEKDFTIRFGKPTDEESNRCRIQPTYTVGPDGEPMM